MFELTPFRRGRTARYINPFSLMNEFEKSFWGNSPASGIKTDIKDNGDNFVLEAELPGFSKEDIKVEINDNYLTINAERRSSAEEKDDMGNYVRMERSYGSFKRSFDVSEINTDNITAEYENGILKLTMPKKEEVIPKTKTLEIK